MFGFPQVASYMRAVLRTLAQCHAQHILHRDIKPGKEPTPCLDTALSRMTRVWAPHLATPA